MSVLGAVRRMSRVLLGVTALAAAPEAADVRTVSVLRAVRSMSWAVLGVTALAACAPAPRGAARPVATSTVNLPRSYRFAPADVMVPAGTRVTWTNADVFTHSVRLRDDGDTTMILAPAQTASFRFTRPGLHRYDCSFHAQMMHGTVEVTAP